MLLFDGGVVCYVRARFLRFGCLLVVAAVFLLVFVDVFLRCVAGVGDLLFGECCAVGVVSFLSCIAASRSFAIFVNARTVVFTRSCTMLCLSLSLIERVSKSLSSRRVSVKERSQRSTSYLISLCSMAARLVSCLSSLHRVSSRIRRVLFCRSTASPSGCHSLYCGE
eukprot:1395017-Rhodomonas_salina.2